jgi:hypothetical protein
MRKRRKERRGVKESEKEENRTERNGVWERRTIGEED